MTPDTLLLRQVNPHWIREGRVTSQTFKPTAKDKKKLSAHDGDQMTAEDAYRHYTQQLGLTSAGVIALTVQECQQQALAVTPDPEPFPEHVLIDFLSYSNAEIVAKAKHLTRVAMLRGWLCRRDGQ